MVITCEECSTRFNLDESLLKKEGSKVRCCRCRHVFTVFPPPQPSIHETTPPLEMDSLKISTETDIPDEFTLDNDLDLGLSVKTDELTLDDDLSDAGDSETSLADETFDLDVTMEEDDFFLDEDFDLEQKQDQDSTLKSLSMDDEFKIDEGSDELELSLDDDMDFDDELELELEDYGDLDLSDPDSSTGDQTLEQDSDADLDFDLELDLDINPDTGEPDFNLEVDDAVKEPNLNPEMDPIESDFDLGMDIPESDSDLEMDIRESDSDLEMDIPETDIDLEMDVPETDIDLEMDVPETDIDLEMDVPETDINDKEMNLTRFDEVLEAGEDDPEIEEIEPLSKEISGEFSETDEADDEDLFDQEAYTPLSNPEETENENILNSGEKGSEMGIDALPTDYGIQEDFKKPFTVAKPIILILLLAILILAGYSASIFYGIKIPYLSNLNVPFLNELLKPAPPVPLAIHLAPDKKSVNGRFVTNTKAGTLFVVTGSVTNTSREICSHIKVKGSLITREKIKAKEKTVFCGNLIDEEQLKNGEMDQINRLLARETGNNQSNVNIQPERSVPFMVVFSDLPENLENFTVNVEGFDRKAKEK